MPSNKNAYIRYRTLDACFRNRRRRYFIEDLLEEVNDALAYYNATEVEMRTLRADIRHMELEVKEYQGVQIEKMHDGHAIYYRYNDPSFTLFKHELTEEEAQMIADTIKLLSRFKGLPQFDWIEETLARLRQSFQLDGTEVGMVSFTQNPDLNGLQYYGRLFEGIVHHQVLSIEYHRFGRKLRKRIIHPYQLRQWNNRWYLVGYEKRQGERFPYVVLALDRMTGVEVRENVKFVPKDPEMDFDDYYYDIVGISLNPESKPEKVVLKAYYPAVWYIETKPLHPSQRVVKKNENENENDNENSKPYKLFELTLIPNEELVQALIVYADQLEVVKGDWLRNQLRTRAENILKNMPM